MSKKVFNTHQLRLAIESIPAPSYERFGYYGRWASSCWQNCLKSGVLQEADVVRYLGQPISDEEIRFSVGQKVRVRLEASHVRFRRPHLRTPGYLFGAVGEIERVVGNFENPESEAFVHVFGQATQHKPFLVPLYRVRFLQRELWPDYEGNKRDTVEVEVFQPWLDAVGEPEKQADPAQHQHKDKEGHKHGHKHEHEHDHVHEKRVVIEQNALEKEGPVEFQETLAEAVIKALLDKNVITAEELRRMMEVSCKIWQMRGTRGEGEAGNERGEAREGRGDI